MEKIILLDAGHGGLVNGVYITPGKRSPVWSDGSQYFEGVGNRLIRRLLAEMLIKANVPFHFVTTGNLDISIIDERVPIVNSFCDMYGAENCLLISIHSNGHKKEKACGWEVYTTRGTTRSDRYATMLFEEMKRLFRGFDFRVDKTDGDVDKEANYTIIAETNCPAILSENFFHTNETECKNILMTSEGRYKIALAHFNMIKRAICA